MDKVKIEREEKETKQSSWFIPQSESSSVPLHFQGDFTIIQSDYKCSSKKTRDFKYSSTQARDFLCSSTKARDF